MPGAMNGMTLAGKPIYYDGTHLWLLPKCSSSNTLVSTTTNTTKPYNSNLLQNTNNKYSYAKVNGTDYLFWFDRNVEVNSYNINTATSTSLNLKSQLQQQGIQEWQRMTVYNNKLLWEPGDGDNAPFITYDLSTRQFSTLGSADWDGLKNADACYTCGGNTFFVGTADKLVYANRPRDSIGLETGYAFITVRSAPSSAVTKTKATVTSAVTVYDRAGGSYYTLSPSGTFKYYHGVFRTDVAIDCKNGLYSRLDDYHILLGGEYTYFAMPSTPNTLTIGSDAYDIVPANKLPKTCLQSLKPTFVSYTAMQANGNIHDLNYAYSSPNSNNLVLYRHNDNRVYNTEDNTVTSLTLQAPPKPQNPMMLAQPPNGQYYYPVSINTEFDYWLYRDDGDAAKCKLVKSTDNSIITIPGNTIHTNRCKLILTLFLQ